MAGENYGTSKYASAEQLAYAAWLDRGMKIGFVLMVLTLAVYLTGLRGPHIPLDQIAQYWTMNVHDFLQAARVPVGWGWLSLAGKGDYLNFLPIAFLGAVTIVCFGRILVMFWKSGEKVYAGIAAAEILVLVLAASGILAAGH